MDVIIAHLGAEVHLHKVNDSDAAFLLLSPVILRHILADDAHRCEEKYDICNSFMHRETFTNCDTDISLFYILLYPTEAKQDN